MNASLLPNSNVWLAYGGALIILVMGTSITYYLATTYPERDYSNLRLRVRTWWLIVPALVGALSIGPLATVVLFALASAVALHEYLTFTASHTQPAPILVVTYAAIPVLYGLAYYGNDSSILAFVPPYWLLLAGVVYVAHREVRFQRAIGTLSIGILLTVFSLSYIARLVTVADGTGLVVFLLMTTQLNDVSQYVWGKLFGRKPLAPTLSPNKTQEGMFGGLLTTAALAALLGPLLTPLNGPTAAITGVVIALAGVAGDLTVSGLKRVAGVKDAGKLLPGHGGFFDRMDSLIYAAPLFFYGMLAWRGMQ